MSIECHSCGEISQTTYRCEHCGHDLTDQEAESAGREDRDRVADGGRDWAWIVECPHGRRSVVEDDVADCAAFLQERGDDTYDLRIASWSEPQAVAADGGVEPGYYVVDEAAGVVLEGPRERHRDALREVTDERQVVVHADQLDTLDVETLRWATDPGQVDLEAEVIAR